MGVVCPREEGSASVEFTLASGSFSLKPFRSSKSDMKSERLKILLLTRLGHRVDWKVAVLLMNCFRRIFFRLDHFFTLQIEVSVLIS